MKNSFSIVWGGEEENEYPQIPMDFSWNMTLTLNRGWSKDNSPQPQGWSLIPHGDGTEQSWQSVGKSTRCSEVEVWHTESHRLWLCPTEIPCGHGVSCTPVWNQASCPESQGVPALSPPQRSKPRGCFLQRQPGGRTGGLAGAERLRKKHSSFAHCVGISVQENNQFLGLFMWSQLLTQFYVSGHASSQPPDWQQAGKKHQLPTAIPACSLCSTSSPTMKWKTITLLGDTISWGLYPCERALNKMHSIHVV